MFNTILANLKVLSYLLLLFAGSYLANIVFGTFYNIKNLHEYFEKDIMIEGLKKGACLVIGFVLIIIILGVLPEIAKLAGVTSDVVEGISIVSIASVIVSTSVKYLKDAIAKMYKIITNEEPKEENDVESNESEEAN